MSDALDEMIGRIEIVRGRIVAACDRVARDPESVTLIAVSKTHDAHAVALAAAAGLCDFGENRVQEATPKIAAAREIDVRATWHMVGHLQTNKVKAALECFDILHSVDSLRLARAISENSGRNVRILVEVNVAGESSKSGVTVAEAGALCEAIAKLPRIELIGVMTVAPQADNPEEVRPVFRSLKELRDTLGLRELSMGMTDDFEVAVEEAATMVRVGRAIFGAREG